MAAVSTTPRRRGPRVSGRGGRRDARQIAVPDHESEYDLLAAALIGASIGAGMTFMLRRGPSGRRPIAPILYGMGRGARWAGTGAATLGASGARWAADRADSLWERIPRDAIRDEMRHYLGRAREAIDDAVESELHDLRRAIRRRRKRLGV